MRASAIAVTWAVWTGAASPSSGETAPATAGMVTAPVEVARCEAVRRAFLREESYRVVPPTRPIRPRARPARLTTFPEWLKVVAPASSCSLYFWITEPFEGAPVVDRATGLMWFGVPPDEEQESVNVRDVPAVLRRLNAGKVGGFSDWRLPTMPELLSMVREKDPFPMPLRSLYWSADRTDAFRWLAGGAVAVYTPFFVGEKMIAGEVRAVRTMAPTKGKTTGKPPPAVTAGLVGDATELAGCRRAEWAKHAEGREVPVKSRARAVTMRANPEPLTERELTDRLNALYLLRDDGRCFVNDYRPLPDGSVFDAATGLAWQVGRSEAALDWTEAWPYVHRVNDARYLGHDDWRLPTVEEAATLIESVRFLFPATRLDPGMFATSATIWTSDPRPDDPHDDTWVLNTTTGEVREAGGVTFVKLVRSVPAGGERE